MFLYFQLSFPILFKLKKMPKISILTARKRFLISSLFCIIICFTTTYAQITLRLKSLPAGTPAGEKIYAAGNFNNWNPSDTSKNFKVQNDGSLSLTFTPSVSALEFKLTRGSWATVEGSAQGGFVPNRKLNYSGNAQTEDLTLAGWEGQSGQPSTAAANVKVLNSNFNIPQLGRERRIWLYLPPDYAKDTTKRFPVFYLHDGQNLFDKTTSFSGEWQIDESLNQLVTAGDAGCIVVGIDNGGANRLNEYSPWRNARYGGGEGAAYTRFLVETLKPYIDANFRTKKDREHTAIGGSSMGGLISMYALMEHQDVFSKAMVFSPAFWFALDSALMHVIQKNKKYPLKVYFTAGTAESADMIPDINKMEKMMIGVGFRAHEYKITPKTDGQHNESFWAREFPDAYRWLFGKTETTPIYNDLETRNTSVTLFPNPSDSSITIEMPDDWKNIDISIYDIEGKEKLKPVVTPLSISAKIDLHGLARGTYFIKGVRDGQVFFVKKFVKE